MKRREMRRRLDLLESGRVAAESERAGLVREIDELDPQKTPAQIAAHVRQCEARIRELDQELEITDRIVSDLKPRFEAEERRIEDLQARFRALDEQISAAKPEARNAVRKLFGDANSQPPLKISHGFDPQQAIEHLADQTLEMRALFLQYETLREAINDANN